MLTFKKRIFEVASHNIISEPKLESYFLNVFYPQKMNDLHLTPKKGGAGWDRWLGFKERHGSVMRQPENLSMNKAQASSYENIERFYDTLEEGLRKIGLVNKQERIWNLDERGFSFVPSSKSCQSQGAVTIYQQTTAEKVETSTLLLTINAAGDSGLSLEISKGVRLSDEIRKSAPPSTNVNIPPLKPIQEVRKRASAAKKSSLFMGDATSSDISTDPIPEKSPEENFVIRPNRKKVRIQRSQSDNVENGTAGPSYEFIPECLTLFKKIKKQSRRKKNIRGKWRKLKTAMSCEVLVQEVLRTLSGE